MSRTIKAIERHMILPVRLGPRSRIPLSRLGRVYIANVESSDFSLVPQSSSPNGSNADQKHFPDTHSKVALGLRASVFCDDRRRGRLGGVMPGTIEAVATHSGSLTKVGSEPAKSIKDDRP